VIRPLLSSGRQSLRLQPQFALPGSPFGLKAARSKLKELDRKGGIAPHKLVPTPRATLSPNDRASLEKKLRLRSKYYSVRKVVSATGGPLGHLIALVDDLGFQSLHAWRAGDEHKDKVLLLKTCLKDTYSPWIQRVVAKVVGQWLTAITRTHRVCTMIDSKAIDLICEGNPL
jgi:hypothetical protein